MKGSLRGLLRNEDGLETVEYAILTRIIILGTLALIASIALWVNNRFGRVEGDLRAS